MTSIHTSVDALGNLLGFFSTGGEVFDPAGADESITTTEADTFIADKIYITFDGLRDRCGALKAAMIGEGDVP